MVFARLGVALRRVLAPACVVCGLSPGDPACPGCRGDFFPLDVVRCRVCANRLPAHDAGTDLCGRCLVQLPGFDRTVVLGDYAPPLDGMVAALKFHARLDLGCALGELLAERSQHLRADAVVPLPLAPARLRERGYNQAEELARAVAAHLRLPLLCDGLARVRHCPAQHGLRLAQRRANVRGAFAAPRPLAAGHVLLVDDVITSGSTLDEAAACLKRAGARCVTNLVVARTP